MVEHVSITDPEIHEPKGVATASSNQVYVADGAASGSWAYPVQDYADIYTRISDSVSIATIGTTAKTLVFSNNGLANGATADASNNKITVAKTGVYRVDFSITFDLAATADAGTYTFTVQVAGSDTNIETQLELSDAGQTNSISTFGFVSATATNDITVTIESDNGSDTDDIAVSSARLSVQLVRQTA